MQFLKDRALSVHIWEFLQSESTLPKIAWDFSQLFSPNPRVARRDDSERFWSNWFAICQHKLQSLWFPEDSDKLFRPSPWGSFGILHRWALAVVFWEGCLLSMSAVWRIGTDFGTQWICTICFKTAEGPNLDRHTKKTQQQLPTGNGKNRIINFRKIVFGNRSVMHCQINCPKHFCRSVIFCAGTVFRKLEKAVAVRNSLLERSSGKFRRCWKMIPRFSGSAKCYPCQGLGTFRQGKRLLENWPPLREHCWIFSSETATTFLSSSEIWWWYPRRARRALRATPRRGPQK